MSMEEKQNSQTFQDFSQSTFKPKTIEEVSAVIKECYKKNIPLEIVGLKSKNSIGRNFQAEKTIEMSDYSGVIEYQPEELYIKVKAGTSLKEIKFELDKNNQQLAFEPIDFGLLFSGKKNDGSIGGVVSCNFSGSRRFKVGSARDHILGFQGVNGKGEIIKSGGTVVKNVTGYDLSKIVAGSYGTLVVLTEISIKVLPKSPSNKTIVIENPHLRKALEYLNLALSSSSDPSGGAFYPEYFKNYFTFNDLTTKGPITAIRIEGTNDSIDYRIQKLCKELEIKKEEVVTLEPEQSNIFWEKTRSLEVFSNLKNNLFKIVLPASETFEVINKLKAFEIKYFVDWGGSLIWVQVDEISTTTFKKFNDIVKSSSGYIIVIKIEENLKALVDVFTIEPTKYKISEKIKKSFDPKRILNPGKMYSGI